MWKRSFYYAHACILKVYFICQEENYPKRGTLRKKLVSLTLKRKSKITKVCERTCNFEHAARTLITTLVYYLHK